MRLSALACASVTIRRAARRLAHVHVLTGCSRGARSVRSIGCFLCASGVYARLVGRWSSFLVVLNDQRPTVFLSRLIGGGFASTSLLLRHSCIARVPMVVFLWCSMINGGLSFVSRLIGGGCFYILMLLRRSCSTRVRAAWARVGACACARMFACKSRRVTCQLSSARILDKPWTAASCRLLPWCCTVRRAGTSTQPEARTPCPCVQSRRLDGIVSLTCWRRVCPLIVRSGACVHAEHTTNGII